MSRPVRVRTTVVAGWIACAAFTTAALAEPVFTIEDPKGDDNGSGVLIYPNREDLQPGDLDLVTFSAEERADGIWFIVDMAQPIRNPLGRVTELGQTPMERIARNGFYTFNIDIYVDTDRVAGSGEVDSIPGRGVAIDRNYAWEKCIVLTPRPDVVRTMLQLYYDDAYETELRAKQGKVSKPELEELQARSEQHVNERFFFPSKVRVNVRRVEFLVPREFLGDAPRASWGYTVFVTGADLEQTGRPGSLTPAKPTMLTMPVARGVRYSQFGIRSDADAATPPVVDLLAPDPETQARVLNDYDIVASRLAAMPGVAPDGSVAVSASGETITTEQAARVGSVAGGAAAAGSASGQVPVERRTVPARLRTLSQLLEEGLITQAEYTELRRKILAEL